MGARSWAWVLNEIKIRVDKRVSKGLLISLLCFIACDLWVCVCVFFDSRLLFFSGFQNKRSVSSSEVCERRLQMLPHTCCCLSHNFSERIYADRAIHRPIAQPQWVFGWIWSYVFVSTAEPLTLVRYPPWSPGVNLLVPYQFRQDKQKNNHLCLQLFSLWHAAEHFLNPRFSFLELSIFFFLCSTNFNLATFPLDPRSLQYLTVLTSVSCGFSLAGIFLPFLHFSFLVPFNEAGQTQLSRAGKALLTKQDAKLEADPTVLSFLYSPETPPSQVDILFQECL